MATSFKIGSCVETVIDKIAFGGDGVGRVEGVVLFVPFTAEGDRVRVRLTSVKKNFLRGSILDIIEPSLFRTPPPCRYYTLCGGCHYQHIVYDRQLKIKEGQIRDALQRIAGLETASVAECIASPQWYGYRGKAEFHAAIGTKHKQILGLMPAKGDRPIDIDRCEIMDESINNTYAQYRAHLQQNGMGIEGTLVFWSQCDYDQKHGHRESDPGLKTEVLRIDSERPMVARRVKDRTLMVPEHGFFQANTVLVDRLVEAVLAGCHLTGGETVLDCFSGSGLFSLFAAGHCRHVFGVEIDRDAVCCASLNARQFGCTNTTFFEGYAHDILRKFHRDGIRPDPIILDPPRTGCDGEVISSVLALAPKRIVYVSCDPATQARDIVHFLNGGYRLHHVQPVDMFPQTKHIEVIATLLR